MNTKTILALLILFCMSLANSEEAKSEALFIVHFETGENWDPALAATEQTHFSNHSANLQELRRDGIIVFGARYGDLGLIILKHESLETATDLVAADPGVMAGIFMFRIEPIRVFYNWQG